MSDPTLPSGVALEEMANATTPGVPTACGWGIDPALLGENDETFEQPLSADDAALAAALEVFNRAASRVPTSAPSPVCSVNDTANIGTDSKQDSTATFEPGFFGDAVTAFDATQSPYSSIAYEPNVEHTIWEGVKMEHQVDLPAYSHEMLPFNAAWQYAPADPTSSFAPELPVSFGLYGTDASDIAWPLKEDLSGAESLAVDPSSQDNRIALTVPVFEPIPHASTFFEFDSALQEDTNETGSTDQFLVSEQLNGTLPLLEIFPKRELPRPTMEELNTALKDSKTPDRFIRDARKLATARRALLASGGFSHGDPSNFMAAPLAPPTMPPRKKVKLEHQDNPCKGSAAPVNYRSINPASGLIRDAVEPQPDDYSEGALIYRVATSPLGLQTPFTIQDDYDLIGACLHDQLVVELNRKLRDGLDLHGRRLIRGISPYEVNSDEKLHRILDFTKKGLQVRIDWMFCTEHLDLLGELDLDKANLDLEEMDRLVKATGIWHFQEWQNDHPGEVRGSR
ncbi:uncharacterized protein N0V89_005333 [Didymosphaeria variabile]|uniref:Uncharacterized protein n=1 Tax=Didymosphaeria variabile TaxID=1932322 RepID=A0A9W9CBM8_9PLEO|nr:uncharacterized protein N0V89_005333 [Didymosphaeria variabile]KAJ4353603.1 hypothetical protein N0V89_005333 [Didymosphaeria variabile]